MVKHLPLASARRHATRLAAQVGSDVELSRVTLAMTIEDVARRALVAPSTVVRVCAGDGGVHLDTLCAVADAVGLRIGVKAFPGRQPSLRDSGQLRIAKYLVAMAHPSLRPSLELPVGDPFGRAADLVFFGPEEIMHEEIERRLPDFQAPYRAATVKRDALQARHARSVRLVLVIEDTRRNRALVAPHAELIRTALPATSSDVLRSLRSGTPLGRDGLLWVRPWRPPPSRRSG
jgi:hypothetical protein